MKDAALLPQENEFLDFSPPEHTIQVRILNDEETLGRLVIAELADDLTMPPPGEIEVDAAGLQAFTPTAHASDNLHASAYNLSVLQNVNDASFLFNDRLYKLHRADRSRRFLVMNLLTAVPGYLLDVSSLMQLGITRGAIKHVADYSQFKRPLIQNVKTDTGKWFIRLMPDIVTLGNDSQ